LPHFQLLICSYLCSIGNIFPLLNLSLLVHNFSPARYSEDSVGIFQCVGQGCFVIEVGLADYN
jgi:hypothetical protein